MAKRQLSDYDPTRTQVGRGPMRPPAGPMAAGQQGIMIRLFWV